MWVPKTSTYTLSYEHALRAHELEAMILATDNIHAIIERAVACDSRSKFIGDDLTRLGAATLCFSAEDEMNSLIARQLRESLKNDSDHVAVVTQVKSSCLYTLSKNQMQFLMDQKLSAFFEMPSRTRKSQYSLLLRDAHELLNKAGIV